MTLELANQSVAYPVGVAEYVFVKVRKFYFLADFAVVDYDVDPRVPLILGRPFLRITRALIDVHSEELTLRVNDEAITFKVGHTSRYSRNNYEESVNRIDVINVSCEEYAQEVLGFLDSLTSGNPTPSDPIIASSSPSFTPFEGSNFILEEIKTFLRTLDELSNMDDDYYDTEVDILYLEKLLNEDPSPNLPPMKNEDLKQADVTMTKPSIKKPPELELKDLPFHLEYAFLEGTDKLPETMEVYMDNFLVFRDSFSSCLSHLHKMLKRCEDTNLVLNWEKCHFMVKEGIVLDHKISKSEMEVDIAKVDVIAKLPHPTSVKGAVLGQRKTKYFQPIHYASKTMIDDQAHYTTTKKELLVVVYAFEKFRPYLVLSKTIVYTDHSALKYLLTKQDANLRLLRLENPHEGNLEKKEINKTFPLETLGMISFHEAKALFTNDAQVVVKFLKSLFAQFGTPRAIISNRGENQASWFDKLDDTLWAFRTAFKTPIGYTPDKLVYEKACHLPIEQEHKAYWALKHCNFDLKIAGDHRRVQMNELNELRDQAYENSLIYREKTMKIHDSKIKNRVLNVEIPYGEIKVHIEVLSVLWGNRLLILDGSLPLSSRKVQQREGKNKKLKGVKARVNFGGSSGTSRYSESRTMSTKEHEKRHRSRCSRSPRPNPNVFSRIKHERSRSLKQKLRKKEGGVFKRLGERGKSMSAHSDSHNQHSYSRYTEAFSESEDSGGGHWKSRSKKKKPKREEDDLSQPRLCEEIDPFTPRIIYYNFPKTRMPSHIKTYDGSEDPEDHLKKFQITAKTEQWAMPTWCHMFNSTLTGNTRVWFDDLPAESIESYNDQKKAFMENYLQQKKYIKDLIELHNIKQRDGESTEDFVKRFKLESTDVKGAPECMRIYRFVHGITNPELINVQNDTAADETEGITLRHEDGGPVSIITDTNGMIKVLPPKTAEEVVARERERKARTTLLMALPEDHLAKFDKMADAKEMWEAIKFRFGGNDESKKMQKYLLKQQFEGFSVCAS
nr:reverse transcriptase domain-containing protein [Tanacetum cinerariifolium]